METKQRRRWCTDSFAKELYNRSEGRYILKGEYVNYRDRIKTYCVDCSNLFELLPREFMLKGNGCPYCNSGGRTKWTNSEFLDEVDKIHSDRYTVLSPYTGSSEKIKVKHNSCGLEFYRVATEFLRKGKGCPRCFNKNIEANLYKTKSDETFKSEVNSLTDNEIIVLDTYINSRHKNLFKHKVCGQTFKKGASDFLQQPRCPHCSRKKMFKYPSNDDFLKDVKEVSGGDYVFLGEFEGMAVKIPVKHLVCGSVYSVTPSHFMRGRRCPNCVYSRGEKAVADVLDSLSIEYSREHTFEYLGRKRFDFFIPSLNIAIEYDGEQHFRAVDNWGGEDKLKQTQESDALKNDFCEFMGIDLLRIPHWEFDNINEIVTNFIDTVKLMRSISDRKEA